ncbi:MAG: diguanylate cyclase domain-containing protein [Actinomycetota bacterium]
MTLASIPQPHRSPEAHLHLLHAALEASTELVLLCDRAGVVLYANEMARTLMQVTEGDASRDRIARLLVPASARLVETVIASAVTEGGTWTGELTLRSGAGLELPLAVTIQMHPGDGKGDGLCSVIAHDISELKHTQARLEHRATHDPLTSLPNRALFQELGNQALARADRSGTAVAVLFLDLDQFKPINDCFGHPTGDELLVQVAARLRASVRRGDTLARFGGDEFVVLCEQSASPKEMGTLAGRLIRALSEPVRLTGVTARVGASVGIAIGAGDRTTIDTLVRDADAALYRAKEQGRGRAVLFTEPHRAPTSGRRPLRSRPALSAGTRRASRQTARAGTD